MTKPLAVQLYSLREEMENEVEATVEKIASIGFVGVETASFPDSITPMAASKIFKDLDLVVAGAHLPLPIGDDKNRVIETVIALDCDWIVNGAIDRSYFKSIDGILRAIELFNEAADAAQDHGLQFVIHNHWWEFEEVDGQYPYQIMLERLSPVIYFELDAYWIQVAGHDPKKVVHEFGIRAPFLHVKDGPAMDSEASMVAVGEGAVNYPEVIKASDAYAKWLIVELDRCSTDMMTAVERSYAYLVGKGMAHGRQS
jgi:sugar phosphate isomerase/epimerase